MLKHSENNWKWKTKQRASDRNSHREVFLENGDPKICNKFTGEHPCRNAISIKLQGNFIDIALRHGCSPVNLLHIFRTPFPKNTSGWLLVRCIQNYTRPEVNLNWFEISNCFEMSFCLHGNLHRDFTAASFQTIARLYCTCANDIF